MPITLCSDREIVAVAGFHERYGPSPLCEDRFARADGFESIDGLFDWFEKTHGLPFMGLLIEWEELEGVTE